MLVPQHFDIAKGHKGFKAIGSLNTDNGKYFFIGNSSILYDIRTKNGFLGLFGETINFQSLVTAQEFNLAFSQLLGVELTEVELKECIFESTYIEQTTRVDTWLLFDMVSKIKSNGE